MPRLGLLAVSLFSLIACSTNGTDPSLVGQPSLQTDTVTSIGIDSTNGKVGGLVTLTGVDFTTLTSIKVGGVDAIPISTSSSSMSAYIMPGTSSGSVTVTTAAGVFASSASLSFSAPQYPTSQQGGKLTSSDVGSGAYQGSALALSSDGNTMAIGAPGDGSSAGAVLVYSRTLGIWTQQGTKLIGTSGSADAQQGAATALSADGNTLVIGGPYDNSNTGAVWVFTRSGNTWSQQGAKLVGTGAIGGAAFGSSVDISADGNTVVVGGPNDNSGVGASWIFARSGGSWSQQGAKLVGTGATGTGRQGTTTGLSADGTTAVTGAPYDGFTGAAWVFVRSGSTWSQQGTKLVGTGIGSTWPYQGTSVDISANGNTVIVGAPEDESTTGAAWIYSRSGSTWSQQGPKLVGTGAVGNAGQGYSVALSADGNTAMWGGPFDNSEVGAAWVFTRSAGTWTQHGAKLVGAEAVATSFFGWTVGISSDGSTGIASGAGDNVDVGATWVFAP